MVAIITIITILSISIMLIIITIFAGPRSPILLTGVSGLVPAARPFDRMGGEEAIRQKKGRGNCLGPPVRGPLGMSLYVLISPYSCKHFVK